MADIPSYMYLFSLVLCDMFCYMCIAYVLQFTLSSYMLVLCVCVCVYVCVCVCARALSCMHAMIVILYTVLEARPPFANLTPHTLARHNHSTSHLTHKQSTSDTKG